MDRRLASEDLVGYLKNPDALFDRPGTRVIKDQRKIKVARAVVNVAGRPRVIYLKRFNAFSWRYRLGSLILSSGAVRALRGAQVLAQAHIPAARAVAAVEFRSCGMVTKSFFLTDEIIGGKTADAYWREDLDHAAATGAHGRRRDFLRRRAEDGDAIALAELRKLDDTPRPASRGAGFVGVIDLRNAEEATQKRRRADFLRSLTSTVAHNGDVLFSLHGRAVLRDEGRHLSVLDPHSDEAVVAGLQYAPGKIGGVLTLSGPAALSCADERPGVAQAHARRGGVKKNHARRHRSRWAGSADRH